MRSSGDFIAENATEKNGDQRRGNVLARNTHRRTRTIEKFVLHKGPTLRKKLMTAVNCRGCKDSINFNLYLGENVAFGEGDA